MSLSKLQTILTHSFTNEQLLEKALTHRSVSGSRNNERLEFIGDSIVNFTIAEALFQAFPDITEGQLSRMRAHLVKKDTLAIVAKQLGLGEYLKLGGGELKSGGYRRESILADALEALIAAIYIDSDMQTEQTAILGWFKELLANISPDISHKDPKTILQEYLQGRQLSVPDYTVTKTTGKDHQQEFYVLCNIKALNKSAQGHGGNRRRAEQAAAKQLLQELQHD
jgi:ribonuclease-3